MKHWKYQQGTIVVVNNKAKDGAEDYIGKLGVVEDFITTDLYDYRVRLEGALPCKFKEEELDYFLNVGDSVEVKHTREKGKVITIDFKHKQVELRHPEDGCEIIYAFAKLKEYELVDTILDQKEVENKLPELTNTNLHKKILDEKHDIFVRKNADYGNSFSEQYKEYGLLSAVIRLDDKLRRLKQLLTNIAQVKDESIRDTLLDLSNYADMTVMEIDKEVK